MAMVATDMDMAAMVDMVATDMAMEATGESVRLMLKLTDMVATDMVAMDTVATDMVAVDMAATDTAIMADRNKRFYVLHA